MLSIIFKFVLHYILASGHVGNLTYSLNLSPQQGKYQACFAFPCFFFKSVCCFEGESVMPEFCGSICGTQSIREVFGGIQV